MLAWHTVGMTETRAERIEAAAEDGLRILDDMESSAWEEGTAAVQRLLRAALDEPAPETAKAMVDKAMRRAGFSGVPETAIERRPEMEIARAACGCVWCAAGNPEGAPLSETIDCRIVVALRALRLQSEGDKP